MINTIIFDIGMVLVDFCWRDMLHGFGLEGDDFEIVANATVRHPAWEEFDKGTMTITSKGELKGLGAVASGLSGVNTKVRENTFFETHCYAPIDVEKPFTVVAKVNVKKLEDDRLVGFVFNYRDGGNYYAFAFNGSFVKFIRYENNKVVGEVMQGLPDSGKRRADMQWTLDSDGNQLTFKVDGAVALNIRYMPLQYAGFGFYTFGNQELIVDEVEFIQ